MQRRALVTVVTIAALAAGWTAMSGADLAAQRSGGTSTGTGRAGDPVMTRGGSTSQGGRATTATRGQRQTPPTAVPMPTFQVDPLWPKPLPNGWILGSVTGVAVTSNNQIWIVHRGADSLTGRTENGLGTDPPTAEVCCRPAPSVLGFDVDGNLIGSFGGPGQGYDWPQTPGGIAVDAKGNIWIAAAGWPDPPGARGAGARGGRAGAAGGAAGAAGAAPAPTPAPAPRFDAHLLKFSPKGEFLQQIGKPGASEGNDSKTTFNKPANLEIVDNEIFVADGYGNRRVVVLDANTGAYKRHWGAYGAPPESAAPPAYDPAMPASGPFRTVTCATVSKDGRVYVCDRQSDRIQVFEKSGKFIAEAQIAPATLGNGSVWDIALSSDSAQSFLFVADGQNHTVLVLRRDTLEQVGKIGSGGRWPGTFYAVGSVATDARGNLYTGETYEGKRVQKFVPVTPPARGRGPAAR